MACAKQNSQQRLKFYTLSVLHSDPWLHWLSVLINKRLIHKGLIPYTLYTSQTLHSAGACWLALYILSAKDWIQPVFWKLIGCGAYLLLCVCHVLLFFGLTPTVHQLADIWMISELIATNQLVLLGLLSVHRRPCGQSDTTVAPTWFWWLIVELWQCQLQFFGRLVPHQSLRRLSGRTGTCSQWSQWVICGSGLHQWHAGWTENLKLLPKSGDTILRLLKHLHNSVIHLPELTTLLLAACMISTLCMTREHHLLLTCLYLWDLTTNLLECDDRHDLQRLHLTRKPLSVFLEEYTEPS